MASAQNGYYQSSGGRIFDVFCGLNYASGDISLIFVRDFHSCVESCVQWSQNTSQANACVGASFVTGNQGPAGGNQCWLKWSMADSSVVGDPNTDSARLRSSASTGPTPSPVIGTSDKISLAIGLGIALPTGIATIVGVYFGYRTSRKRAPQANDAEQDNHGRENGGVELRTTTHPAAVQLPQCTTTGGGNDTGQQPVGTPQVSETGGGTSIEVPASGEITVEQRSGPL